MNSSPQKKNVFSRHQQITFLAASDVDDVGVVSQPIAPQDGDALTRPKVSEAQVAKDASQRSVRPDLEQCLEIGLRPHPTITFSQEREQELVGGI